MSSFVGPFRILLTIAVKNFLFSYQLVYYTIFKQLIRAFVKIKDNLLSFAGDFKKANDLCKLERIIDYKIFSNVII